MISYQLASFFIRAPSFPGQSRIVNALLRVSERKPFYLRKLGLHLRLDTEEWLQRDILRNGGTEPLTTSRIQNLLDEGDTFVDVGAHIGFMTLVARKRVGATGRVIAFEPQPYNCDRISENWRLNNFSNIKIFIAAASNSNCTVDFGIQPKTDRARLSIANSDAASVPRIFVQSLRLDSVQMLSNSTVKLLKIDVEGHELEVLRGLDKSIARVENIILELLGAPDQLGGLHHETLALLRGKGFVLKDVNGIPWTEGSYLHEGNLWAHKSRAN